MIRSIAVGLGGFALGCTFYTACPPGSGNGTPSNGGTGSGAAGGSSGQSNLAGAAPTGSWVSATGSLEGMMTGYGDVTYVASKPDEDLLIAGLSANGLWSSVDGAQTWQAMGMGAGSAAIPNRTSSIQFDPDHSKVFWQSGTYGSGVFMTVDDGDTFAELGTINYCEALGIDFSDSHRKTLLAAGHEQGLILWLSTNGGSDWADLGMQLPAGASVCSYPLIIDAQTFLITCSHFNSTAQGIFRSMDAGQMWTQVSTTSTGAAALHASDDSIYWANEGGGGLLKSKDKGQTWNQVLSDALAAQPIELPDTSIAVVSSQYVVLSSDGGATWRPVTSQLPYAPAGLAYSDFHKALYIWHVSTDAAIPTDALESYDFDYSVPP